jgi:hypothetical protein
MSSFMVLLTAAQQCGGYAVTAGSSSVAMVQDRLGVAPIKCGDVDIYVPLHPKAVEQFYKEGQETGQKEINSWFSIGELLNKIEITYGWAASFVHHIDCGSMENLQGSNYAHYCILLGIVSMYNLELINKVSGEVSQRIQIMVVKSLPRSRSITFQQHIVSRFDIDLVKAALTISDQTQDLGQLVVTINYPYAKSLYEERIREGRFTYIAQPMANAGTVCSRIEKYWDRGFVMVSFRCHCEMITPRKVHVVNVMLRTFGVRLEKRLRQYTAWHCYKSCGGHPSFEGLGVVFDHEQDFLRAELYTVLKRWSWNDVAGDHVSKEDFLLSWYLSKDLRDAFEAACEDQVGFFV